MSYATEKVKLGRTPCTIVEIDLDFCSLTYGSAPCAAVLGTTGSDRCFNTRKTCQDPTNYSPAAKTYRFSNLEIHDPSAKAGTLPCLPFLLSVSTAPTILDPGNSIGVRASITCSFKDAPYTDRGLDNYVSLRSYTPEKRSTFWPKLIARNPFYFGRALRVLTGYLVDGAFDSTNFVTRHYIIDSITGPDQNEGWAITAKDALKLADDSISQAPVANTGILLAAISDVDLSFTVTPAGTGDAEYASSGTVFIDKEAITFTRSGDVFTVVGRGTDGTSQESHDINAPVQQCLRYTSQLPNVIIKDILVNYCGISSSYIDDAAWESEAETWLIQHKLTRLIVKPTGCKQLLDELCKQGLSNIWWDEVAPAIRYKVVRPAAPTGLAALDETYHLLEGTVSVNEDSSKRITQVHVFSGLVDFTLEDKDSNFSRRFIAGDSDAESDAEYGTPSVLKVYSRWLGPNDSQQAALIAFRLLSRYINNLRTVVFALDAKDSGLWTGDNGTVQCRQLVDIYGAQFAALFDVIQVQDMADGTRFNYQVLLSNLNGRYGYITENDMVDYDVATDAQKLVNGFITQDNGKMPDNTDGYVLA